MHPAPILRSGLFGTIILSLGVYNEFALICVILISDANALLIWISRLAKRPA